MFVLLFLCHGTDVHEEEKAGLVHSTTGVVHLLPETTTTPAFNQLNTLFLRQPLRFPLCNLETGS